MDVSDLTRLQPQHHAIATNRVVPNEPILQLNPPILAEFMCALEARAVPPQLPPGLSRYLHKCDAGHSRANQEARLLRFGGDLQQDARDALE
jgi:hypothetical protein